MTTILNRRSALQLGIGAAGAMALGLPALAAEENPMPAELRKSLEHSPLTPVLGNPKGDITLTEFFDYNCPFCRKSVPDIHRLITEDKNLRVVFWEWAVFGEGSVIATQISLASLKQGKYWQFHSTLMGISGKANEKTAMEAARKVGLDEARLRKDMESAEVVDHMDQAMALAEHMGLVGTPTFIAGNEGLFGKQSYKDLTGLLGRARKTLA